MAVISRPLPTKPRTRWRWLRPFLPIFVIIVGTTICAAGSTAFVDGICYSNAATWIPYYPNAEVVSEDYNWIRPFGIGKTTVILKTADSSPVVGRWYRQTRQANGPYPSNLLATLRYKLQQQPDGGVMIYLTSECGAE